MKLLAQFYACLAIIVVFTAVFSGIEARSSNFMTAAGSRRGWLAEEQAPSPDDHKLHVYGGASGYRVRRAAPFMTEEKPDEPSKRHHTEDAPDQEEKRTRRQAIPSPPGMPNPEDMAKQIPMPQGRK